MKTEIYLGKINLAMAQGNAGIFYGDNTLKGWRASSKRNLSLGRVNGDGNFIASRLNFLNDSDIIDMFVKTQEPKS
ncbi:hypothetical protein L7E55_06380 [Pelotomaculum isophthalicicum JI]|uniref:Uncharacterized protein n=1 Tax=Pelotomaculum isophthalicicum JI TaxID=947010 RepID=A0A9X4H5B6_9FIRM|nr:hypothetical protein [Pelotomaculum isophthalicicum]MDF9407988.1 hypothetical protein [Pelotomaculum isophthalicicum JI]